MTVITSDDRYATSNYIVAPTIAQGANYSTIQAAINAASAGSTIVIKPGTYTENLTLKAGVNIASFENSNVGDTNVTIVGKSTFTGAGTVTLSGLYLTTNSDYILSVTGSSASVVGLQNCYINASNSTAIQFTSSSSSAKITLEQCNGSTGTTGIALFTHSSAGSLNIRFTDFGNTGASSTASTISAGVLNIKHSSIDVPISMSSTALGTLENLRMDTSSTNSTSVTVNISGAINISKCNFISGSATPLVVTAGTVANNDIIDFNTSSATGISGAGTYKNSVSTFPSSATRPTLSVTTLSQNPIFPQPGVVFIESKTASNSASLDFTTLLGFTKALFVLDNVCGATATSPLWLQYSTDGGSTFLTSAYHGNTLIATTTAAYSSNGDITAQIQFGTTGTNYTNGGGFCGSVWIQSIYTPNYCSCQGTLSWLNNDGVYRVTNTYGYNNTTEINAFRWKFSSGNINVGTISLYGVL